jgi:hypothetical protein
MITHSCDLSEGGGGAVGGHLAAAAKRRAQRSWTACS